MTKPARPKPPHRFVYVIGPARGLQKLGLATDPRTRLAALQTASASDLRLHIAIPVPFGQAHAVEQLIHKALARCLVKSEWFDVSPREAVAAVRAAAATKAATPLAVPAVGRQLGLFDGRPRKDVAPEASGPLNGWRFRVR